MEVSSKFYVSFSSGNISPTTHQKAFIFGPWDPWRVCFPFLAPGFMPAGSCSGVGLEVKNYLKKCYTAFSFMLIPSKHMSEICHQYDLGFCVLRWRSVWPIFHCWVILPNILKTIWWMNIILGIMDKGDTKIYVGQWPVSQSSDFAEYHTFDNGSVWCNDWP